MVARVEMDADRMLRWDVVLALPIFWVKIVNWLFNFVYILNKNDLMIGKYYIVYCMISFGWFPGVWILYAHVWEHSVPSS